MDTNITETTQGNNTNADIVEGKGDYNKNLLIYIGIAAAVLILLITQTICFVVYIRKVRSEQRRYNNFTRKTSTDGDFEGRYKNAPRKQDQPKPAEESNELYECIKPAVEAKPPPPPIATLPKTPRSPLPLPQINADKASTFTAPSTQQFLEHFGRQVSTMPLRPAMDHFNPIISNQSHSPNLLRPKPTTTPQLLRRKSPMQEKPMIYESLPDIRNFSYNRPPSSLKNRPAMPLPSEALWKDISTSSVKHKPRVQLPNESSWNASGVVQSNSGRRKPPAPLPTDTSRNITPTPSTVQPNLRGGHMSPGNYRTQVSLGSNLSNKTPEVANELMEKLRRRAELISPNTSITQKKHSSPQRARENPSNKCVEEDSSDEEWTMEELKTINMYNI